MSCVACSKAHAAHWRQARLRLLHVHGRRLRVLREDTGLLVRRDLERLACLEALRDDDLRGESALALALALALGLALGCGASA